MEEPENPEGVSKPIKRTRKKKPSKVENESFLEGFFYWFMEEVHWFYKLLLVIGLYLGGSFLWTTISDLFVTEHVEGISQEFIPMSDALDNGTAKEKQYDLEETIRIIHAIEYAQQKSPDFQEFLIFMAKQDYSLVSQDVIDCQKQLLPILQDLYFAQDRLEEHGSAWQVFKDMGGVTVNIASAGIGLADGDISGAAKLSMAAGKKAISVIKEREEISKGLKATIKSIQDDYIDYLSDYTKVYFKHMHDWNELCNKRDPAYMDIQQGRMRSAMEHVDEAMKISPSDKETRILKTLCLLQLAEPVLFLPQEDSVIPKIPHNLIEANDILDAYLEEFPERSAPATLLKGIYYYKIGDTEKAFSSFDQSSKEYPKQALLLKDMFNSYEQRQYLINSRESQYLFELYKSTMEGFGIFSPNFHKAMIHQSNGEIEDAQREIKGHFFRRGHQFRIDYLISDMDFCNNYLSSSFNSMFREKSFVDIEIELGTLLLADNEAKITIRNRTDMDLENAKLFLCLHLRDTWKENYVVTRAGVAINIIPKRDEITVTAAIPQVQNAKKDIVTARGILVTDNFIAWVDKDEFKVKRAEESVNHYSSSEFDVSERLEDILKRTNLSKKEISDVIINQSGITLDKSVLKTDKFTISLPRKLTFLDPIFSVNQIGTDEAVKPKEMYVAGPDIKVSFDLNEPKNGQFEFFIYSTYLTCKISIIKDAGKYRVSDVGFLNNY